jgi:hypothetical protein
MRRLPNQHVVTTRTWEFTFAQAGTYYVGVSANANATYNPVSGADVANGATGGYTLRVTGLAG